MKLAPNSAAARAIAEQRKASLAEHAAEGGSLRSWGVANGVNCGSVSKLWARIKADLGAQAV